MRPSKGIALVMTLILTGLLVILLGAFVGVNRTNSTLTGNTVHREAAHNLCLSALNYCWYQLELNQGWAANGFPDGTQNFPFPNSGPAVFELTQHGDSSAPDDLELNYVEGVDSATQYTFEVRVVNNLTNRNPRPATALGDVPGRSARVQIRARVANQRRELDVDLRKRPFVDTSALSNGDMVVDDQVDNLRLYSRDPYVNQIRSNLDMRLPSALGGEVIFRDPPRGGVAMAHDELYLGGSPISTNPTLETNSEASANGDFVTGAATVEVPDLEREHLTFPEFVVDVPPGSFYVGQRFREKWEPVTVLIDTDIPPDGIPESVTRYKKQTYAHNTLNHVGLNQATSETWTAETSALIEETPPDYSSAGSDGFVDGNNGPLNDYPVLYGQDQNIMSADLLTGEIYMAPGTSFQVDGPISFLQDPNIDGSNLPAPELKFGFLGENGNVQFPAGNNPSAIEDPGQYSSALVAESEVLIEGQVSGFGSIYADGDVRFRAKPGLRADPNLSVAVRGETVHLDTPTGSELPGESDYLQTDWEPFREALGTPGNPQSYQALDNWNDLLGAQRLQLIENSPGGLRERPVPRDLNYYWGELSSELNLNRPAPSFVNPPSGGFTLEHYVRLRNYAVSLARDNPDSAWLNFDGARSTTGVIAGRIGLFSLWGERMFEGDHTFGQFMSQDEPLVADLFFVGLVHAQNFFANLSGNSIYVEGALVSQGNLRIDDSSEVTFNYNRIYLDDVVQQYPGNQIKLDQVYFNIK